MGETNSWNLQKKISDLKFVVPSHVVPIRNKVLKFVEEKCYPLEKELEKLGAFHGGMGVGNYKLKDDPATKAIRKLQDEAKAAGLWALGHPKEIGGQGMPFRDYIYVNEIQGRSELAPLILGTHSLQDSLMLFNHGSDELKKRYLNGIVAADILPSFAMTEPDVASSDPTQMKTHAKLENGEWVINGVKWFTSNAANAEYTCVMVRTEFGDNVAPHAAFSIILVPTNTPGYQIVRNTHVLGTVGADHSEVVYKNVRVPASNLIGKRGGGFLIAQERLGPGRIFHCMRWCGVAQRCFDLMVERLVERKVNGGKNHLGEMQLMQQHIFDSYCDIQALRLMTLNAAEKMDSGDYARVELSAVKGWGGLALGRVVDRAVQVFGAKGLTDDTPLSGIYRNSRGSRVYDGPDATHIVTVGKLLFREYKKGNRYDFSEGRAVPRPELPLKSYI